VERGTQVLRNRGDRERALNALLQPEKLNGGPGKGTILKNRSGREVVHKEWKKN